jgi:hypothetical protein
MMSERDEPGDPELPSLLARWGAEPLPEGMDERVLAAYRRDRGTAPSWWRQFLTSSVRIPLPVALGLLLLFVATAALALRPAGPTPTAATPGPAEPVQAARASGAPVVTRTSLAGFQPVSEVTATVVATGQVRP